MKKEALSRAIGEIETGYVEEYLATQQTAGAKRRGVWRVALPIAACLAMVGTMLAVMMIGGGAEEREPYMTYTHEEEWYVRPVAPYVDHEIAAQLKPGMYLADIVELIGKPNRRHLNDGYIFQWNLDNGKCLHISFSHKTTAYNPELNIPMDYDLKVTNITIEDHNGSYHVNNRHKDRYERFWSITDALNTEVSSDTTIKD